VLAFRGARHDSYLGRLRPSGNAFGAGCSDTAAADTVGHGANAAAPPLPPDNSSQDCNPTASLRPFAPRPKPTLRWPYPRPRPADRRARYRQQPIQLPGPDHRRDHRIRRRHRQRDRARHLRRPFPCRVPDPCPPRSAPPRCSTRRSTSSQDHDHHLRPAQAGELLHRLSRRQPAHPGAA